MPPSNESNASDQHPAALPQTRWSLILEAKEDNPEALADLCRQYWQPLYAFARHKGRSIEDAQDLTQSFMLKVISKEFFKVANPDRGRLRSLLLFSFQNHMVSTHRSQSAAKRGGGVNPINIDAMSAEAWLRMEPSENLTPELEFDRQWAREIIRQAKLRLQETYAKAGKGADFDAFAEHLDDGSVGRSYREIAAELGVEESKARYIGFKIRQRFRNVLVEIVEDTVASREEAPDELEHLLTAFETPRRS